MARKGILVLLDPSVRPVGPAINMVRDGGAEEAECVQPEEGKGKLRSHHNLQWPDRRGMKLPRGSWGEVRVHQWDQGKSSLDRRGKGNPADGDRH